MKFKVAYTITLKYFEILPEILQRIVQEVPRKLTNLKKNYSFIPSLKFIILIKKKSNLISLYKYD